MRASCRSVSARSTGAGRAGNALRVLKGSQLGHRLEGKKTLLMERRGKQRWRRGKVSAWSRADSKCEG
jgi:hypothetical protein